VSTMDISQQPQSEWTLQGSGLVLHTGDLIEYASSGQTCVATVRFVTIVGFTVGGYIRGEQVVHVKLYGRRSPREGSGERSVKASEVIRFLDAPPVPPQWNVELLYPKHHFHQLPKSGKIHVVRNEITPLWGGPPVDRSEHTLCGLSTAESQCLNERDLPCERICGSCLRNLRLFRLSGDDWRKRGQYLREYRLVE
jgi:hypothetical protein